MASIFKKGAVIGGLLVLPDGNLYGGSQLAAPYGAGTIALTNGSASVVGTGTSWVGNVDPGMLLMAGGRVYIVKAVGDNTHLTLVDPYQGATASGVAYTLSRSRAPALLADYFVAVSDRLLALKDDRIYESPIANPAVLDPENFVQIPAGVSLLGGEAFRDTALLFTTAGVWQLSNVALDITDTDGNPQQRLEQVNRDLTLWSWAGVTTWGSALIVPATDGVWLLDALSAPVRISYGVQALYERYVNAGYTSGYGAIYNGHYLLPIYKDGVDGVIDVLTCRLTPTRRGRGDGSFGWTRQQDPSFNPFAFAVRTPSDDAPYLLGASPLTGEIRRLDWFDPDNATPSNHVAEIVTREFQTGGAVRNFVSRLITRYELDAAPPQDVTVLGVAGGTWPAFSHAYYRVSAIVGGSETAASPEVAVMAPSAGTRTWRVSWSAVPGATSYRVYRGSGPSGSGNEDRYFTTAGTSYDDVNPGDAGTPATVPGDVALGLDYSLDGGAWVPIAGSGPEAGMASKPPVWQVHKQARGIRFRIRTTGTVSRFILHMLRVFIRSSGRIQ